MSTFSVGGRILPISLQGMLEPPPPSFFEEQHFCSQTSFHFDLMKITSGPGQSRSDQGNTVRAKNAKSSNSVLLLSKPGIYLDKKKYPGALKMLISLGMIFFSSKVYPHDYTMMINTIGATSATKISKANVKLVVMRGASIKEKYPYLSSFVNTKDTYIVVIALSNICIDDVLLCNPSSYGNDSKIPVGTKSYIRDEKKCYRAYENAIAAASPHQRICYRCFATLQCDFANYTLQHEYMMSHRESCIPHMNRFILPQVLPLTLDRM